MDDVFSKKGETKRTGLPALPYARLVMIGTAAIEVTIATENTISASLKRQGKRFVQCFVFSKIDITVFPYSWEKTR